MHRHAVRKNEASKSIKTKRPPNGRPFCFDAGEKSSGVVAVAEIVGIQIHVVVIVVV